MVAQHQLRAGSDIHAEIAGRELEVLARLGIPWPPPRGRSHIHCHFPDHPDKNPSWRWDDRKWRYHCSCSSGSIIDAVMHMLGLDFAEAAAWLRGNAAPYRPPDPASMVARKAQREREAADNAEERLKKALYLWGLTTPADGTVVEAYLASRGVTLQPLPCTLSYLPSSPPLYPYPAMVAAFGIGPEPQPGRVSIPRNRIRGIHLTYLLPDGSGKAPVEPQRRAIGPAHGTPIVLSALLRRR